MTEFDAHYYDGLTSTAHAVRAYRADDTLRIVGEGLDLVVPLGQTRLVPPVTGMRHTLALPGGGQLRSDAAALPAMFPGFAPADQWQRKLESKWRVALGALVGIALFAAWGIFFGIPIASKSIAENMPTRIEDELGRQSLDMLDRLFCKASQLEPAREKALRDRFVRMKEGVPQASAYLLEFRACKAIGANAFALPSGIVVVTDELVKVAENDEQILAVLAHEIGHAVYKHPTRMAVQGAGVAILVTALASDAVAVTSLAVVLPTLLLESGYSREFESEADEFAFRELKRMGISTKRFAEMLEILEESHEVAAERRKKDPKQRQERSLDYMSTHPATDKRIQRAIEADR